MINKKIQSLWIGDSLSVMEKLCISSFIKNGHDFHLYTYGVIDGVPDGTIIQDANNILSQDLIFTYHRNSYAGFADWFRWALLKKKGGIWVDTDMICLKYIDLDDEILFGKESSTAVCPAILKFPSGHPLVNFLENQCRNPNTFTPYDSKKKKLNKIKRSMFKPGRHNIGWGETGGPKGFTKALEYFDLLNKAKPFTHFFPVHCNNWDAVFDGTLGDDIELFSSTYTIHMWNEMTRKYNVNKNGSFPKDSLYEVLKRKYL